MLHAPVPVIRIAPQSPTIRRHAKRAERAFVVPEHHRVSNSGCAVTLNRDRYRTEQVRAAIKPTTILVSVPTQIPDEITELQARIKRDQAKLKELLARRKAG